MGVQVILSKMFVGGWFPLQKDQRQTIGQFREGALNLLISTSVAEEGLDIPECNMVVRYGLLTNEIAMQQASGRARAGDSVYSVVAQAGGQEVRRERTNEYLEELNRRAIAEVQNMDQLNFKQQVWSLRGQPLWPCLCANVSVSTNVSVPIALSLSMSLCP